ncbi:hypothetical protein BpHYR1_024211 [Brachionus plicatilis]|uniref:Uncharacterized protein n=1 Tax=Brachionus plicatilis TaxID=10195 RepID=A0A3M7SGZ3_BRAPC|nr:hypothetical protein BpHYR1_024211 [Brachionus plicatilis]
MCIFGFWGAYAFFSSEAMDPSQTLGYYVKNHPSEMIRIKTEFKPFVPVGVTFEKAWQRAENIGKIVDNDK